MPKVAWRAGTRCDGRAVIESQSLGCKRHQDIHPLSVAAAWLPRETSKSVVSGSVRRLPCCLRSIVTPCVLRQALDAMFLSMHRTALICRAGRPPYVPAIGHFRTARTALAVSRTRLTQSPVHRRSAPVTCVAKSQRQSTSKARGREKREVKVKLLKRMFRDMHARYRRKPKQN